MVPYPGSRNRIFVDQNENRNLISRALGMQIPIPGSVPRHAGWKSFDVSLCICALGCHSAGVVFSHMLADFVGYPPRGTNSRRNRNDSGSGPLPRPAKSHVLGPDMNRNLTSRALGVQIPNPGSASRHAGHDAFDVSFGVGAAGRHSATASLLNIRGILGMLEMARNLVDMFERCLRVARDLVEICSTC
jgi:hypothetical protein